MGKTKSEKLIKLEVRSLPGEVLSQNEIDALLSALSSGEMDADELKKEETEKKVRVYDFKRALRFSKDQIRNLTRIHENFARLLTTYFSAQLRTYIQISVASADQLPYEEFIRSIPKMTILNVFDVHPLDGSINFILRQFSIIHLPILSLLFYPLFEWPFSYSIYLVEQEIWACRLH